MLARVQLPGVGVMAGLATLACSTGEPSAPRLALEPCRLDGLGVEARCGKLRVFEDRDARSGRELELRVAVVPALAASPRPDPLFILVGGPGQAATEAGAPLADALLAVRRRRDIVLVDQRGTGQSHPLTCETDEERPLAELLAPESGADKARACHAALDADTTRYATPAAMDDLEDVRAALGYEHINLWGGSYGTRAALVYLRAHPEHVRSVVLDGSAPFALRLPLYVARDAERALGLLYADCERDPDCQRRFPEARRQFSELLDGVGPSGTDVRYQHPRSAEAESVHIDRAGLAGVVRNSLYVPQLGALLPLAIERAIHGDFGSFVAAADAFARGVHISTGMFLSIVCAEDVPRFDAGEAEALTRGTFLGGEWLADMRAECDAWPAAQLPESYFEPVRSDTPALLLSGNIDPVTPPSWGEQVARDLSRSRHIVVPGGGHGTSTLGCVPNLIAEFLETPAPGELDAACVERLARPAFFTSLQGPSP
jgi:pimeloyl-ACP methyl ester carboxylesterase